MGLGELAIKVGLGKSTVHKLLRTLVDRGYVRQDPATKHYALTLRSWQVGMVALSTVNVREVALPHLRRLSALTGEQSTLWLYDDGQVVCVQRVETRHRVRSYTRVGAVEPALDLAAGRCLLAHQPAAEVRRVAERLPDPGAVGALEAQLRRIRTQGYDLNTGERWTDVRAIAAPIRDHAGEVVAGLSVSGPDGRFDEDSVSAMLPHVVSVAAEISAELGHPAAERAERSGRG
jgi:IclR family acetate operon transcriptional repressor